MMTTIARPVARVALALCTLSLGGACTEPVVSGTLAPPSPTMSATLMLSDSLAAVGSTVSVIAQLRGSPAMEIGSYSIRIGFDSTALRYEGEAALADEALRAINPQVGVIRLAGAGPRGFSEGRLAGVRFLVLRADGLRTLRLSVDEMHTITRTEAASRVRVDGAADVLP